MEVDSKGGRYRVEIEMPYRTDVQGAARPEAA
jgi:hypothetical protein